MNDYPFRNKKVFFIFLARNVPFKSNLFDRKGKFLRILVNLYIKFNIATSKLSEIFKKMNNCFVFKLTKFENIPKIF